MTDYEIELSNYLLSFATENRKNRMENVLSQRTRYLTIVLEDIFQPHNASAVVRSCDGFGIHDIHIIENRNRFKPNKDIDMGTTQWLNIQRYRPEQKKSCSKETLQKLKAEGYRIVATTPHTNDVNLEEFDLTKGKAAIVFGTELNGITKDVEEEADEFMKIPMHGFVESFNISVACALTLHHLSWKLRDSEIDWQLKQEEKDEILLDWLRKTLNNADSLEKRFKEEH
ncbi:MAG: RNA methyltransferase [Spirochaetales bacterium]|nr:RNA methyltransferase [Spirochaetales bacterium]